MRFILPALILLNALFITGAKCAASFVDRCITFVGENAAECVKTSAFLNLTKDGLIKLISSDYVSKLIKNIVHYLSD